MPANKNAMTRYRILDELLNNQHRDFSLNDLTSEVNLRLLDLEPESTGVVRRTIENDLRYLEHDGPFKVDIERYSVQVYNPEKQKLVSKQCLRYKRPDFSIFKRELGSDETHLLMEFLSLFGTLENDLNFETLENMQRESNINVQNRTNAWFTHQALANTALIGILFHAIKLNVEVEISYSSLSDKEKIETSIFYPCLLKEYNGRWFVFGTLENRKTLRCFGVERLKEVKPLQSPNGTTCQLENLIRCNNMIGISDYVEKKVEHVEFWVNDESIDYVMMKPIHPTQIHYTNKEEKTLRRKYPQLVGGGFFTVDCKASFEMIREFSAYGDTLLILSPDRIQKLIYEKVTKVANLYEKLQ